MAKRLPRPRGGMREGSGRKQQWYKLSAEVADALDAMARHQQYGHGRYATLDHSSRERLLETLVATYVAEAKQRELESYSWYQEQIRAGQDLERVSELV